MAKPKDKEKQMEKEVLLGGAGVPAEEGFQTVIDQTIQDIINSKGSIKEEVEKIYLKNPKKYKIGRAHV